MFDTTSQTRMQRSHGEASVRFAGARLRGLAQRGSAKALLPRVGAVPEVVFLNTSGGLTGGDRLRYQITLDDGRAVATTQAAERAYRANADIARVEVHHRVGAGGWLDWLPQETILFDNSALSRNTLIELERDAGCLMLEAVVLGRAAMGEVVRVLKFQDHREIRRAGRPVLIEPLVLGSPHLDPGRVALLGASRALATMVLCCSGAEDALNPVRAVLDEPGVEAAASGFDGKCVIRMLARDGWPLRRQILRLMTVLRRGAAPPRVWQI